MSESKKFVAEWLLIICVLIAGALFLSSCTANRHLQISQNHYEKAIAKGYEPTEDTTKTMLIARPVILAVSDSNRFNYLSDVNTLLMRDSCLNEAARDRIIKIVDSIIIQVPKDIKIDTVYTLDNGGKIFVSVRDAKVNISVENICIETIVYVERLPYWAKWVIGISILFLILILFSILSKIFL
jgi:hypothetical protein